MDEVTEMGKYQEFQKVFVIQLVFFFFGLHPLHGEIPGPGIEHLPQELL